MSHSWYLPLSPLFWAPTVERPLSPMSPTDLGMRVCKRERERGRVMQWALDVISHGVCETCSLCPPGDLGDMASEVMRVFIYVVIALRRPCGQALIYTALSKVSSQKSFALHGTASSLRTSFKRPIRTLCIPPVFTVFSLLRLR